MRINIGSQNEVKISALKETICDYSFLSKADVLGLNVSSDISEQPKSLDETIRGAMNRAKNAFQDCDFSFGLEGGLMRVPYTKTGHLGVNACAIYDGQNYHLGLSSAFEYPSEIIKLILKDGLDVNQAFYQTGLTKSCKVGSREGAIGILTQGRLPRKEYIKQAIIVALINLENLKKY